MIRKKSLFLTYILALFGGLFGLHHLYLGRTQHALLWITTFGGFGIGFIYEFVFLIAKYVREANNDDSVLDEYRRKMMHRKTPPIEISRLCGQFLIAVFYGFITYYSFPDTWHQHRFLSFLISCYSTFAIAVGIQLVGTLGPRQCSFIWPLLGAMFGMPLLLGHYHSSPSFNLPVLLSLLFFQWKVQWNSKYFIEELKPNSTESQCPTTLKQTKKKRMHILKRCLILGLGIVVFSTMFTSAIYQNLHVNVNGRRVKVKHVLSNYFKSKEFILLRQQLLSFTRKLWAIYLEHGFKGLWNILDLENKKQAYEVLNLSNTASQKDIESQCRTLSRQWHPDRYRTPEDKANAEVKFMNVQQACDRLSHERKRRQLIKIQNSADTN